MPMARVFRAPNLCGLNRSVVFAAAAALAACIAAPAMAQQCKRMVALLDPCQVVPPISTSQGEGCAVFFIDTATNTVAYEITIGRLTSTEEIAALHDGPVGVGGPSVVGLPLGNPKVGTFTYPESEEADLLEGRWYIDIHTSSFPGSEIRGQIVDMVAELDSAQLVPPGASNSKGWAMFMIDPVDNRLDYFVNICPGSPLGSNPLSVTINGLARHTTNGAALHTLPSGGFPKSGTWLYDEAQEDALLDGLTYINVPTTASPTGQIRGQITASVVPINRRQETPSNSSAAYGYALVSLDRAADALAFDVDHNVANETVAHIHGFAPRGGSASPVFNLAAPAVRKIASWSFGGANEAAVLDGRSYFNIHSLAFGNGEIRGQIEPFKPCPCPGDADRNESVGLSDIALLVSNWATTNPIGDLDGDGLVGLSDVAIVVNNWTRVCR